jgi:hypothetical protein
MYHGVLTTGDVSRMLRVSSTLVVRWIDEGRLFGWHLPGSNHHRTTLAAVQKFCLENEVPIIEEFQEVEGQWSDKPLRLPV